MAGRTLLCVWGLLLGVVLGAAKMDGALISIGCAGQKSLEARAGICVGLAR